MKKNYYIMLLLTAFSIASSSMRAMEELPVEKYLTIKNSTGETIKIVAGLDKKEPAEAILVEDQEISVPFEEIESLNIASERSFGRDYMDKITPVIKDNPNEGISVIVEPPETSGWFGGVKAYVNPYELSVEATEKKEEAVAIAKMPESKKIIDTFPLIAKVLKEDPKAKIVVTDIIAVSPQASAARVKRAIELKKISWENLINRAQTEEEEAYAKKILAILDTAALILRAKPEIYGKIITKKLGQFGIALEDPEKAKKLEVGLGALFQRGIHAQEMRKLRNLLLEIDKKEQKTEKEEMSAASKLMRRRMLIERRKKELLEKKEK